MNIIYEGTRTDGTHILVSPSKIRSYMKDAIDAACGNERRTMKLFTKSLCTMLYVNKIKMLVAIRYNGDGSQKRELLAFQK